MFPVLEDHNEGLIPRLYKLSIFLDGYEVFLAL